LRKPPHPGVPSLVPSSPHGLPEADSPPPGDPDLAHIVAAWSRLPKAIKAGILAMVQAAGGSDA